MPETLLIIAGVLFLIAGFLGAVLPILPGPPLSFAGMLMVHLTPSFNFPLSQLIVFGILAAAIAIIDLVLPVYATRKTGGSKNGMYGATIGLVVGMFMLPPIGIFIMPFVGALVAEMMSEKNFSQAVKAATGSFLGLLAGALIKMAYSITIIVFSLIELF